MSVIDRFKRAQEFDVDLFVSIHVNASGGLERVSGIETHFLDSRPFFYYNKKNSLFCSSDNNTGKLVKKYQDYVLKNKIVASKLLSYSVQSNIINLLNKNVGLLRKKKFCLTNRGVKRTVFRTLIRSFAPACIVEVGFITNKKESEMLSDPSYQGLIANGITKGIDKFFK